MRIRVLVAVVLAANIAQSQSATPLSCEAVVPPSDSGSGRFGDVAEGRDGRLAWTDGRPGQFLLRDARGNVRVVGRRGAGPGEFNSVGQLGWLGDTVWVSDGRLPRVTFFSDTGRLIRVATGRPDGRLVGIVWMPLGTPTFPPWIVTSQRSGELGRDTLKAFRNPSVEHFALPPANAMNPQPFAFRAIATTSPDGSRFCNASPDGDDSRIECVDDRGRTLFETTLKLSPRPLTDAVYDSMIAVFGRGQGRTKELVRDLIKRPRNLPPVMNIMLDDSGEIWLRRSHSYEAGSRWTRVRSNGSIRDDVEIPQRYRVMRTRGDAIWAAAADSEGLETLYRCRLR
jgi:hypothetical protein